MTLSSTFNPRNNLLYLDCFSGLSGDMILSALIDLGVPLSIIEDAAAALPLSGYQIRTACEMRTSIRVCRFFVDVDQAQQPHRHFSQIRAMIAEAPLHDEVKKRAIAIFTEVARAEARVHGTDIEHVHFHEVGAVDSIVDIVGAAAAIHYLGVSVMCAPVPLGIGFVQTQHGTLPIPAPATLIILEGVPVVGTDVASELTTPTGAAIVKVAASSFGTMPAMIPAKTGFGAGSRTQKDRPGILRAVLGQRIDNSSHTDACVVMETNVDDMTGEVAAHAARAVLEEGALDVWTTPIQMKKGRPALVLSALCTLENVDRVGARMLRETTSIGIRYHHVNRMEMLRQMTTVETPFGPIRAKLTRGPGNSTNAAAEFDDCEKAAEAHNVPLKQVIAIANGLAWDALSLENAEAEHTGAVDPATDCPHTHSHSHTHEHDHAHDSTNETGDHHHE